jgi:hypothetical protein
MSMHILIFILKCQDFFKKINTLQNYIKINLLRKIEFLTLNRS